MRFSPRRAWLLLLTCGLAGFGVRSPAPALEAAAERPRLVLALSVDQMRFDYLTRFAPLYTGGLKTLRERGAVFRNARFRHACTETGPGHSVFLSGRSPKHSGIVGNDWYDSVSRRIMNVVDDPVHAAVGGRGRSASPRNFIGFTLGDVLKRHSPRSRVVGVAGKDRSAILMGGHRADAAYWYGTGGAMVTSTYYMPEPPAWLTAFNERKLPDGYATRKWTRLLADEAVYLKYAGPDDVKGEWDSEDTVFPHAIRGRPPEDLYYDDLRRTPFADEIVLAAALAAISAHGLGADDDTDLLAVGLSATDSIGHTYGPDSQELMDQLLRVDRALQQLFDELDRRVGLSRVLVALSADHGVLPLVEVLQARGVAARRAGPDELRKPVEAALQARFPGATGLVATWDGPNVYLDLDALGRQRRHRAEVEKAVIDGLMESGLVDRVYTHADLLGEPPADDPEFPLFRNAFFQPRSAHLVTRLKPYVYVSSYLGGTTHGTVHDYDRHVPVVFMGAGVPPGTYDAESGPEDVAPTLGALLGLDYPEQDGRTLREILP
ncbi:MAG TPA: alkaline phosphatase family protein [Vicinamibacteria bacterium]|nr:alkaline phosphatase family protein [Vicinamibacteria bacterium]